MNYSILVPGISETTRSEFFKELANLSSDNNYKPIEFNYKGRNDYQKIVIDLNKTINNLKSSNNQIIVLSHSLGSYLSLASLANTIISGSVSIDPSLHPRDVLKHLDNISNSAKSAAEKLPDISEIVAMPIPKLFIGASKGGANFIKETYYSFAINPKTYVEIESDHNFSDDNSLNILKFSINSWLNTFNLLLHV